MNKLYFRRTKAYETAKKTVRYYVIMDNDNNKTISDIYSEIIMQTSYKLVIRDLKTVFKNSGDPFVYSLYCSAIQDANNYYSMNMRNEIKTEMKLHTRTKDTITGKFIECIPYYSQKIVYDCAKQLDLSFPMESKGLEKANHNTETFTDSNIDDLISVCYLRILELIQAGQITCYNDIKLNKGCIYSAINTFLYSMRSKKTEFKDFETMMIIYNGYDFDNSFSEKIITKNKLDKLNFDIIRNTLVSLVNDFFPRIDSEKCIDCVIACGLGFDTRAVAEMFKIAQTQVVRYCSYVKRLLDKPETKDDIHNLFVDLAI